MRLWCVLDSSDVSKYCMFKCVLLELGIISNILLYSKYKYVNIKDSYSTWFHCRT